MNDRTVNGLSMTDQSEGVAASLRRIVGGLDDFAATSTSSHITTALDRAYKNSAMTFIAGVPGVGKTKACKHFVQRNGYAWRCQFTRYTRTTYTVMSHIATAVNVNTMYRPGELGQRIEWALTKEIGLLICDEAQHLTADGFEIIRGLYDTVNENGGKLGVALVGHTDLEQKLSMLPQLIGRVASPLRIASITPADVDVLLDRCGVADGKIRTFLRGHAGEKTGFRRIVNALHDGVAFAAAEGVMLNATHVRQAWADLAGSTVK